MYFSLLSLVLFGIGCWVAHWNYCNLVLGRIAPDSAPSAWKTRTVPFILIAVSTLIFAASAVILVVSIYDLHWIFSILAAVTVGYFGNFLAIRTSWLSLARKYPAELAAYPNTRNKDGGGTGAQ